MKIRIKLLALVSIFLLSNISYSRVYENVNFNNLDVKQLKQDEEKFNEKIKKLQSENGLHDFKYDFFLKKMAEDKYQNRDDYLGKWYQFHKELQAEYDVLILKRQVFIVKQGWKDFNIFLSKLDEKKLGKYEKQIQKIKKNYEDFVNNYQIIGGDNQEELRKHRKRHIGFGYFFECLDSFYLNFRSKKAKYYDCYNDDKYSEFRKKNSLIKNIFMLPLYAADACGVVAGTSAAVLDLLTNCDCQLGSVNPLSNKIDYVFRMGVGHFQGINVHIRDKNFLPDFKSKNPMDVFLLLPLHQIGTLDAYFTGELKLPRYMIFSNPMAFAPTKFIGQRLANHPDFISVGLKAKGTLGSVEQVENALENGRTNTIVNYPQGHLGPNNVIPINGMFAERMVKNLIDKGFNIHVTPLIWHAPSTFPKTAMNLPSNFPLNNFEGQVLPNMKGEIISFLIKKEFDDNNFSNLFEILIRSIWIEKKTQFEDLSLDDLLLRINLMKPAIK